MNIQKIAYLLLITMSLSNIAFCGLSEHLPMIGNEKEVVRDAQTGNDIIFLTTGKYINSTQYPHNKAWLENDKYIMFESTRPRPQGKSTGDGSDYRHVERQLCAADINTGDIYHLASLEVEDTAKYGENHLSMSSQYHSDYAPGSNVVVYYDMTGHNLYMLDLDDGHRKLLWNVKVGTIGDPPSITDDGSRVVVYVAIPGPDNGEFFSGRTTAVFYIDLDPETNEIVSGPKVVTTWTHRTEQSNPKSANGINLTHSVINPVNKEELIFCHGYPGYTDGSVEKARTWYAKTDGSEVKMANLTEKGWIETHELWGPKGRLVYFIKIRGNGGISAVEPRTGKVIDLIKDIAPRCLHLSVSGNEKRFVFDTQRSTVEFPLDEYQNHMEDIVLFDLTTGKTKVLAHQLEGLHHPRQMHPGINRNGDKVYFTVADGPHSRAAYLNID
ncbi:MAG: oligogalacturonate lyase family protein [Sedimentisphaeraceae bacterium JB056]